MKDKELKFEEIGRGVILVFFLSFLLLSLLPKKKHTRPCHDDFFPAWPPHKNAIVPCPSVRAYVSYLFISFPLDLPIGVIREGESEGVERCHPCIRHASVASFLRTYGSDPCASSLVFLKLRGILQDFCIPEIRLSLSNGGQCTRRHRSG